jgi:PAS domain S-box-containing protein
MKPRQIVYFAILTVVLSVPTVLCALALSDGLGPRWATVIAAIGAAGIASAVSGLAFFLTTANHERIEQALRESELRFRELAELLPEIVFETDKRGRLIFLNQQGLTTTGYTEEDLRAGLTALDMIVPEDRQAVRDNIAAVMSGRDLGHNEYLGRRKDGSAFPVIVHSTPVFRDDAVVGLRGTVIDITGRKKAENEIIRAKQDAELASRAKSEFLAAMSHELRTPLNAIIGFSDMIKTETLGPVDNPHYKGYIKDINESGLHLLALINDILDLAKIESGKDDLAEEAIDLAENTKSALMLVRQRAMERGVILNLEIEEGMPALWADPRKLKQVFVNLLTNAIKFTDRGGLITFAARRDAAGGLVFEIADTGIGIAPEDIPKALSQFGQVKRDPEYAQEGTGLGLPLTQAIVEQHGGTLELRSQPGIGTSVTVRFPPPRMVEFSPATEPARPWPKRALAS